MAEAWSSEPPAESWQPSYAPLAPVGRPRRGRKLSWTALVLAVVVALGLAVVVYAGLASLRVLSLDLVDSFLGWLTVCGVLAALALLTVVLALVAVCVARPRGIAALAVVCSVLLPVAAVAVAVPLGTVAFKAHLAVDVESHGGDAVHAVLAGLDRAHVNIGPVRDFLLGLVDGVS